MQNSPNPERTREVSECAHDWTDERRECTHCGAFDYKCTGGRAHCGNCGHDWTEYVSGRNDGSYNPKEATRLECPNCKSGAVIFDQWQ